MKSLEGETLYSNNTGNINQISNELSVCLGIYPMWIRWHHLIEVFHLETSAPEWENGRLISCFIRDKDRKGILHVVLYFVNMKNSEFQKITGVFEINYSFTIHKILRFSVVD